ncbi:hypothetical protein TI39_contig4205g00028 [Zymoseptoria brevis]|uniref:Uncharacterized protein n=1 Tax=Zymoseptoria brevis TaxID=1047168 RepID=A0A0F4GB59_9PEZI|nr:hypothetical protein TI39_contig4205g00028 [Zymoseptoria brevis]
MTSIDDLIQRMLDQAGLDMTPDELEPYIAQLGRTPQEAEIDRQMLSAFGPDRTPNVDAMTKLRRRRSVRQMMDRDQISHSIPCPGYGYAYAKYPHQSSAPPPGCGKTCKMCSRSFLCGLKMVGRSYLACLTDSAAQAKLDGLGSGKFGNTILRRWQKMSRPQREALLLKAKPNMYRQSSGYIREADKSWAHDIRHRDLYLLPWLNVEVLAKDASLLPALMHYRSSFSPCAFAEFDHQQIDYSFRLDMLALEYNSHCVTMQGQNFGKLVHWDTDAFHRADMTSFARALLTFDAQHTLSTFLANAITLMMNQSSGLWQESGQSKLHELVQNSVLSSSKLITVTTFSGTPFSAPPSFDIDSIVDALLGRLRAAEDDLWLLQTDAVVAHDHISRMNGSLVDTLPENGSPDTNDVRLVRRMMLAVSMVEDWQYVHDEAELAQATISAGRCDVNLGQALPKAYDDALAILEWVLQKHLETLASNVGLLMISSGAFNKFVSWAESDQYVIDATHKELLKDPVFFHLIHIRTYHEDNSLPLSFHIQQLGEHLEKAIAKDSARIDSLLWNIVEDVAVVYDALTAVRLHRPRAPIPSDMTSPLEIVKSRQGSSTCDELVAYEWAEKTGSQAMIQFVKRNMLQMKIHLSHISGPPESHPYNDLKDTLKKFLSLPCPSGKPTIETLIALDRSNYALRMFWINVEEWRFNQFKTMPSSAEELEYSQGRIFDGLMPLTGHPWPLERRRLLDEIMAKECANALRQVDKVGLPETPPQTVWGEEKASSEPVVAPKNKIRVRENTYGHSNEAVEPETGVEKKPQMCIKVEQTAMTVFTRMFKPAPEQVETRWTDFASAMADAGFSILPGGGSAVSFRKVATRETIVFHRPHPSPNIAPIVLRKMGKRLTRWFQYGPETFVKEKGGE